MEELIKLLYGGYLENFELEGAKKIERGEDGEIRIRFRERKDCCPQKNLVENGYLNSLEVIDNPAGGCAVYLEFERRRWRDPVNGKDWYNQYELKIPGTKVTPRFGAFLKAKSRREIDEFLMFFPLLRPAVEEALGVV